VFVTEIEHEYKDSFKNDALWHEYSLLVRDTFKMVSVAARNTFLTLVDRGPANKNGDLEKEYINFWKARRVKMVEQHLSKKDLIRYAQLLKKEIKDPDFLSPHYSWSGPNSPINEATLMGMDLNEVTKFLFSWEPEVDHFGPSPSREGLGRALASVINKEPLRFLNGIKLFADDRIHPTYIKHLFYGLRDVLRLESKFNWFEVIDLAHSTVTKLKLERLPEIEDEEDDDGGWDSVIMSIIRFTTALLDKDSGELFSKEKKIWEIIETLCEHPNPTHSYEVGKKIPHLSYLYQNM
jgi:hypothetical protein